MGKFLDIAMAIGVLGLGWYAWQSGLLNQIGEQLQGIKQQGGVKGREIKGLIQPVSDLIGTGLPEGTPLEIDPDVRSEKPEGGTINLRHDVVPSVSPQKLNLQGKDQLTNCMKVFTPEACLSQAKLSEQDYYGDDSTYGSYVAENTFLDEADRDVGSRGEIHMSNSYYTYANSMAPENFENITNWR